MKLYPSTTVRDTHLNEWNFDNRKDLSNIDCRIESITLDKDEVLDLSAFRSILISSLSIEGFIDPLVYEEPTDTRCVTEIIIDEGAEVFFESVMVRGRLQIHSKTKSKPNIDNVFITDTTEFENLNVGGVDLHVTADISYLGASFVDCRMEKIDLLYDANKKRRHMFEGCEIVVPFNWGTVYNTGQTIIANNCTFLFDTAEWKRKMMVPLKSNKIYVGSKFLHRDSGSNTFVHISGEEKLVLKIFPYTINDSIFRDFDSIVFSGEPNIGGLYQHFLTRCKFYNIENIENDHSEEFLANAEETKGSSSPIRFSEREMELNMFLVGQKMVFFEKCEFYGCGELSYMNIGHDCFFGKGDSISSSVEFFDCVLELDSKVGNHFLLDCSVDNFVCFVDKCERVKEVVSCYRLFYSPSEITVIKSNKKLLNQVDLVLNDE